VFENKVLRTISGLKKDEISGQFTTLHKGELPYLYRPFSIR